MGRKGSKYEDQSGHAVRSQRTQERVLAAALDLFNTHGESAVTTGHIADALNISPGNLYYHFRNKDDIVLALFRRFEAAIDVDPPAAAPATTGLQHLWMYLHVMFDCIWEYRFIYRNLDDLVARIPVLREHFRMLIGRKRATVVALCEGLRAAKAMRLSDAEIATLADNVLVVATYWLNFEHVRHAGRDEDRDLGRGVHQVMALVAPFLQGEAKAQIVALGVAYTHSD
jgi:AcrR family transcriptional regulator